MADDDRKWCAVPWCDEEPIVWTEMVLAVTIWDEPTARAIQTAAKAQVPFCREHGPRVGSSV